MVRQYVTSKQCLWLRRRIRETRINVFFYVKDLIFLKTKVKYIHNPFDFVDNLPIVKVDTLGIHRKQNMSSVLVCYELRV